MWLDMGKHCWIQMKRYISVYGSLRMYDLIVLCEFFKRNKLDSGA